MIEPELRLPPVSWLATGIIFCGIAYWLTLKE
jgi:hypothetical protein